MQKKNDTNFFASCPKLSEEQAKFRDKDLNLKDLQDQDIIYNRGLKLKLAYRLMLGFAGRMKTF